MIHAFAAHKISEQIRKQLWNMEDCKTSSIIGTLSHLPANLLWDILYNTLPEKKDLPKDAGDLLDIKFWPQWKGNDNNDIEPDVFLSFKNFDIIIELKRDNNNQQSLDQWENEFEAYHNKYAKSEKKVYLIAISGRTLQSHPLVYQCSWTALLDTIVCTRDKLKEQSPHAHEVRILKDAITAFNNHREYHFHYFSSINYDPRKHHINDYNDLFKK